MGADGTRTDALARRDALRLQHSVITDAADAAAGKNRRRSRPLSSTGHRIGRGRNRQCSRRIGSGALSRSAAPVSRAPGHRRAGPVRGTGRCRRVSRTSPRVRGRGWSR
ncbi:hypothetical protein [Nocardia farcinica]|uniref:hypothetical protein n=1 Tax=Nocardia farcinica TaxID=37329 RepID=UPI00313DC35C